MHTYMYKENDRVSVDLGPFEAHKMMSAKIIQALALGLGRSYSYLGS
jgi:hypothetical protein